MDFWWQLIGEHGLVLVFANVLVEQLGVPVPTYPTLFVTGALAARGALPGWGLLLVGVAGCLVADSLWYWAGQRHGRKVLRFLCRISLSPDSCVRQTESVFTRWGAASLLVAKFIPGFASVATALAGALGIRRAPFLLFDGLGAALWIGTGLAIGAFFSDAIDSVIATLAAFGRWGLSVVAVGVLAFVAVKWWRRWRFNRALRGERVDVGELLALIDAGQAPLLLDVRTPHAWANGRIPGALHLQAEDALALLDAHDRQSLVIVYCDCPNDASAVLAAHRLAGRGHGFVRPLRGGLEAWLAAGRPLER